MNAPGPLPVLVAGLGPVGATVALLLAAQGVPVIAVERERELFPHARAVALDDEALRVLQAAGVGVDTGLELLSGSAVRLRGRAGTPLVELPPVPVDTGHPSLAFFRQPQLERLLRARLAAERLVDVRLGHEVVAVRQAAGVVHVSVRATAPGEAGAPAPPALAGAVLVACDGGRSTVRRLLGGRLAGRSAGADWLVVDTEAPVVTAPGAFAAGDFEFGCDPRRPWVHGPLPGGAHRWEFMLAPGETAQALTRPAAVAALLGEHLGGAPPPAVLRAAVYTFHARVATRWRHGRILLAGDAAHLAPPFAGQGLGAGLRDAHNLAWRVAAVTRGQAGEALLDGYARERLPHVARMTALAAAMGAVVQTRRPRPAAVRDRALRTLARSPRVQAWVARGGWKPPSRVGRGGFVAEAPHRHRAGAVLPQPRLPDGAGRPVPGDELLGPGFALLGVGVGSDAAPGLGPAARATAAALGVRLVAVDAADPGGAALAAWLAPARLALVRPDRVVFGTAGSAAGADGLVAALDARLRR